MTLHKTRVAIDRGTPADTAIQQARVFYKRKAAFLDKRRREAEEYAERVCDALRQELAVVREDLGKAYEFEMLRQQSRCR